MDELGEVGRSIVIGDILYKRRDSYMGELFGGIKEKQIYFKVIIKIRIFSYWKSDKRFVLKIKDLLD